MRGIVTRWSLGIATIPLIGAWFLVGPAARRRCAADGCVEQSRAEAPASVLLPHLFELRRSGEDFWKLNFRLQEEMTTIEISIMRNKTTDFSAPLSRICGFVSVVLILAVCAAGGKNAGWHMQDPNATGNPFLGVDGDGNTVPGAGVPFGFVSVSPDTTKANSSGYDSTGLIMGFSHTHVTGTGGGSKYGNFRVTPTVGVASVNNLAFPRSQETARPGYYAVQLGASPQTQINVELTATRRAAMEKYVFPKASQDNLIINVNLCIPLGGEPNAQRATGAEVTIIDQRTISGSASFTGGWNPAPYKIYFFARFDRPMTQSGTWSATLGGSKLLMGRTHLSMSDLQRDPQKRMGMLASFDPDSSQMVEMKLAVSMLGVEQARRNLDEEMPLWDSKEACAAAANQWRSVLNKMRVRRGYG